MEPRSYGLAANSNADGQQLSASCEEKVTMKVMFFIRNGCYLELRIVTWNGATTQMSDVILGRPLLEMLGIDTEEHLADAVDKMGTTVDVAAMMGLENYTEGRVVQILSEGVYHADNGAQGEFFEDEDDSWLDVSIDEKSEIKEAVGRAINDADSYGILLV